MKKQKLSIGLISLTVKSYLHTVELRLLITMVFIILIFIPNVSHAQPNIQQGSKLVGTGASGTSPARQGTSVSISSDGNTAIVGGPNDNTSYGGVWVYTRSGGVWTEQSKLPLGSGSSSGISLQGFSVSISSDGNTAIVGGPNAYTNTNAVIGAAWVYTRSGSNWTQQGNKLVGSLTTGGSSHQGTSVSISSDGNTAIVGGDADNGFIGAAWVYTRSGGVWTEQGKLVGTGSTNQAHQGTSVAISSDGNTAIVGGPNDDSNNSGCSMGAAWVYTRSGGVWTQEGNKLVAGGNTVCNTQQGSSVSISADGNTAIIGGYDNGSNKGAAWIYTRSGGVWTQQGNLLIGAGAVDGAREGVSVSISSDGNIAMVGVGGDDPYGSKSKGAVWIYTRSGGIWTQLGSKLVGTGATDPAIQGGSNSLSLADNRNIISSSSVSMSADGTTAIIGGYGDNNYAGAAWAFAFLTPTVPTLSASSTINCGTKNTTLSIATGTLNSATTWRWYSGSCGGTNVGSGTTILVAPTVTTTYYARGEGGGTIPGTCASITITVNPLPTSTITPTGTVSLCQGGSVVLTAVSSSSYLWSNNATAQSITVSNAGNYSVTVKNGNGCSATSSATIVNVNPIPSVSSVIPSQSICLGSSIVLTGTGATTYTWSDGVINGVSFTPVVGTKTYSVTGTKNGCSNKATVSIEVKDCNTVGISPIDNNVNTILIYPNPNNGTFHLETKNVQVSKVTIYNTFGEIIYESKNINSEIDLSDKPKGTYFIEFYSQDKVYTKQLYFQ